MENDFRPGGTPTGINNSFDRQMDLAFQVGFSRSSIDLLDLYLDKISENFPPGSIGLIYFDLAKKQIERTKRILNSEDPMKENFDE